MMRYPTTLLPILLSSALAAQAIPNEPYACVTLRSDAQSGITYTAAGVAAMPLSAAAFVAADFNAACGGAAAVEVGPHPQWCQSLVADPQAKWIAVDSAAAPLSALYCQSFEVPACSVQAASIRFSFCVDDYLGDPQNGPNPVGVYLNGQPIPGFGGTGTQLTWTSLAIAPLLVAGTNRLQVYVRDNGATVSGVIYSARICYVKCRGDESIVLRSGNGAIGYPDSAIRMIAGAPLTAIPITAANLAAAAAGVPATVVAPAPWWCPAITNDPQAKWISTDVGRGPRSALYSHPFWLGSCNPLAVSLSFTCSVSSSLGDPLGTPEVGLFVNQFPVPLSFVDGAGGSVCDLTVTGNIPPTWLNGNAQNTLSIYVRDTGHVATGVIYSARLDVTPCPAANEVIDLRSGNGTWGGLDSAISCLAGAPASPMSPLGNSEFAAAAGGPQAFVVWNGSWASTLPQDPQARWVSATQAAAPHVTQPGPARTALFAHPFTVNTCSSDLVHASLVLHYHADDGLGDPQPGGGPNPMGLYLNGTALPGTAGDISSWPATNVKTIQLGNIAPYLLNGSNVLYVYVRDRNSGISGVMYSARISISPCDWHYYGDPCGPLPNAFLSAPPTIGETFAYSLRGDGLEAPQSLPCFNLIGFSNQVGPGGTALPVSLGPYGAPGCELLTSIDASLFVLLDGSGRADQLISVPNDLSFDGLPLHFQTMALAAGNNPIGIAMARAIRSMVRRL